MKAAVFKLVLLPPDAIFPIDLIGREPDPWEWTHRQVICPAEGMSLLKQQKFSFTETIGFTKFVEKSIHNHAYEAF